MRTFFIYPNLRKQSAREILPSVCERLRGRDIRLILPNQMRGTMHALHDEVMALDYMDTAEADPASRMPLSFWAETAPCCASPGRRRRMSCRCSASMSATSAL